MIALEVEVSEQVVGKGGIVWRGIQENKNKEMRERRW